MSIRERSPETGVLGWVVITLTGEIDMARVEELDELFEPEARRQGFGVVVDFTRVTFMDSSGLRWLLQVESDVHTQGGQLRLVGLDGPIRRILQLSGLSDHFQSYPNLETAHNGG